ncbi:DUF4833 domain-containing protein [Shimia sp. SDUM112013]|uniref:DUF4833 domain-containing protein n=1 Tax=Shimia sp. SDUM112013 TaxID=3136160 RepID=UPI0032EC89FA
MSALRIIGVLACLWLMQPQLALAAPELALLSSDRSETLPLAQPEWPLPTDPGMVFFLQRSMNSNTVVYAARYDAAGQLQTDRPIDAFWRRYNDEGARRGLKKNLRFFEARLAYGVKVREDEADAEAFEVRFAALPHLPVTLRQDGDKSAALWARIEGRDYRLVYGYVEIDENGLIPKVDRLRLYTLDAKTGSYVTHIISVTGGAIHE